MFRSFCLPQPLWFEVRITVAKVTVNTYCRCQKDIQNTWSTLMLLLVNRGETASNINMPFISVSVYYSCPVMNWLSLRLGKLTYNPIRDQTARQLLMWMYRPLCLTVIIFIITLLMYILFWLPLNSFKSILKSTLS